MKDRKKLGLVLGAVVTVGLIIVGIIALEKGKDQPEETTQETPDLTAEETEKLLEEAFTKTIHDFPDHLIDNLDDQEDTNFVVYAEGVKRVTTDGESNIIMKVNKTLRQYVIANPDEQITSLEKDDVFFMDPSVQYGPGISVKVESMELQEDQVVITGGEMTLDKLIEYADVDMMLSPDEVYIQVAEDGVDAVVTEETNDHWKLDISDEEIQAMMGELQSGSSTGGAENTGVSAEEENNSESNWFQDIYEAISLEDEWDIFALESGDSFSFRRGRFSANGSVRFQTSKIHVVYRYSPVVNIWHFSVDGDINASFKASLEGKIGISNVEVMKFPPIIYPLAGPIVLTCDFSPTMDATVSLGASTGAFVSCHTNASAYVWNGIPFVDECNTWILDQDVNYSIAEINGRLAMNFLNVDVDLGVPMLAELSTKVSAGTEWKGTLKKPSWTGTGEESIHDCEACVDGQAQAFLRTDIAIDVDKLLGKGKELGRLSWTPFNMPITLPSPYDKFYVSFMDQQDPEFGFGKCPHHRWRTDVKVLREGNRKPVPEEVVKVIWADGNEELEVTDEHGELTIYLPKGDNLLSAEEEEFHLRGKAHAVIEDEPIEVELLLGGGDLHIIFAEQEQDPQIDEYDTNSWYELQSKLIDLYPEAQWYYRFTPEELCANGNVEPGDIVLDVTYDAPHTDNGRWDDDYLEDGDNSNIWGEGGGWIYTGGYRICKDQDSGEIIPKMTFGLSVSYDPARKAYLRSPQISSEPYIVRAFQDVSGFYNDEYLLIGYGPREEGRETWNEEEKHIQTDYTYDTEVIYRIPWERTHLPSLVEEYLPQFVGAMMDNWDLDQIMVSWN